MIDGCKGYDSYNLVGKTSNHCWVEQGLSKHHESCL